MTFSDIIIDQTDIKIELVVEKHKLAASKIILLQEINNYKLYKTGQLKSLFFLKTVEELTQTRE